MNSGLTKAVYGKVGKTESNLMIKLEFEMPVAGSTWTSGKGLRGLL